MSRHDEHGPVVDVGPEHGPEWWAMDREWCVCGCSAGVHVTLNGKPLQACANCGNGVGGCKEFRPMSATPLDNQ